MSASDPQGTEMRSLRLDPELAKATEAILMVVDEPVEAATLADVLEVPTDEIEHTLRGLRREYTDDGRGFVLREVAGGWRIYSDPGAAEYVERFVLAGRSSKLSQATLETLAIVAYSQPVTRARVSEIRGVQADGAIRSLITRGLITELGRADVPGQPLLYGTTPQFLEQLGLGTLQELPPLPTMSPQGPVPPEPGPSEYKTARRELDALTANDDSGMDTDGDGNGGLLGTDEDGAENNVAKGGGWEDRGRDTDSELP